MDDLLTARHRPDLLPLCQNPLLLTLMATLHTNRGRLPDDRADLYNESVDLLMLRWNRQIGADKALLDRAGHSGPEALRPARGAGGAGLQGARGERRTGRHGRHRRGPAGARLSAAAERQPGQGRGGGRLHREARRSADRPGREGRRAAVHLPASHLSGVPRRLPSGRAGRISRPSASAWPAARAGTGRWCCRWPRGWPRPSAAPARPTS